jgi:predicted ATPase
VLRDATLPLSPFTLIVGPNGSGKSTVFLAIESVKDGRNCGVAELLSAGGASNSVVELHFHGAGRDESRCGSVKWGLRREVVFGGTNESWRFQQAIVSARSFSLDPAAIAAQVQLTPNAVLGPRGENLAAVLDQLRDAHPERFERLNAELARWLPEFDRVLFNTPSTGSRSFLLRTAMGGHAIPAENLSHGTLIALALLTLAYLPSPPSIIGLEEPDRGLHPRLLRDLRDAIYRLTNPSAYGEKREPVQMIATTHSPLFLDLFRDHPEEVVIAEKRGLEATFQRLSDRPDLEEILGDANLGEVWYSGILGGVPTAT